jgi:hypothetical protein
MKGLKFIILLLCCGFLFSCNKNNDSSNANSTMSATINGGSVTFNASFTNQNGVTVIQGSSNLYTVQIFIQISAGGGSYTIGANPSYPYATVSTGLSGSYTTTTAYSGQINLSPASSSGLYNGNFYFTATGNSGTLTVSNGQFTNM